MAIKSEQPTAGQMVQPRERLIVAILVALLGAIIVWDGSRQVAESAYFPYAVGGALVVLSLFTLLGHRQQASATDEAPLKKGLAGLLLLAAFIWLAGSIGFLTSALWFIPAMAYLGGERRWLHIVIGTVLFDVLAYVVFHLIFSHPFPAELIFGG